MGWHVGVISIGEPSPTPFSFSGTGAATQPRSSVTTGSFTPAANALILVPVVIGSNAGSTFSASDTLGGLTWHQVSSGFAPGGNKVVSVFWAIAPSSPTAGTVTITVNTGVNYFTVADIMQLTSGFTAASPIAQSAANYIDGTGGTGTTSLTATLGSTPVGLALAVLGQSYDNLSPVAPTDDPNFTHLYFGIGVSSGDHDIDVSYASAQQSSTWTNLNRNSGGFWYYQGLIVEIH